MQSESIQSNVQARTLLSRMKTFFSFFGPGYLVAVGYMDPGNWATDLAAGSQFGYTLLCVVFIANLMAMLLQAIAGKLGIVTGMDLAQISRVAYPRPVVWLLWFAAQLAIIACEVAEVIGAAIALNLLFGIDLIYGVLITIADVLLILMLQKRGFRYLEAVVITLIATIGICFGYELIWAQPDLQSVFNGFLPSAELFTNPDMLYLAVGIIGATVMPHNLYLHSSIVRNRPVEDDPQAKRRAIRYMTLDSCIALGIALLINASILILAAATFHQQGFHQVAELQDAYQLLTPILGTTFASILFAIALLAAGQNATLTGTIAGDVVMNGFLNLRWKPWIIRLATRSTAIIPTVIITILSGQSGTSALLIFSQVVLSLQLPFAMIPLLLFTNSKKWMGTFANPPWVQWCGWLISILIVGLNVFMLLKLFSS